MNPRLVSILPTEMDSYKYLYSLNCSLVNSSRIGSGIFRVDLCLLPIEDAFRTHPENALWGLIVRCSLSARTYMLLFHCGIRRFENFDVFPMNLSADSDLSVICNFVNSVLANTVSKTLNSTSFKKRGWSNASSISRSDISPQKYRNLRKRNNASCLNVERTCQKDSQRVISEGERFAFHLKVSNPLLTPVPIFNRFTITKTNG